MCGCCGGPRFRVACGRMVVCAAVIVRTCTTVRVAPTSVRMTVVRHELAANSLVVARRSRTTETAGKPGI